MNIALKYRPVHFRDLVGQDVLARVLENAFGSNRIPQSILLFGNSGVGKTTTARIIALCLNCILGPTFDPCGSCENCSAIKDSRHPDVIEIDAASHTSVEDIKAILGDLCYVPMSSKFKVYIIDEVQMLSSSAFNALLKTIEEPPPAVKFIFATTEIKKIPQTVIARCFRFNLHNIPISKIEKRLEHIALLEGYNFEFEGLRLIASNSNNSMRNALFLMNQVMLYSKESKISYMSVTTVLGLTGMDSIFKLLGSILDGDPKKTISIFNEEINKNDPLEIIKHLLKTIHLVCRFIIMKRIDDIVIACEASEVKDLSKKQSIVFFIRLWELLLKGIQDIKSSVCSKTALEMLLIKLCYLTDLPSPEEVIKKILVKDKKQEVNYDFDNIKELLKRDNQIYLYSQVSNNVELIKCMPGSLRLRAISKLSDDFSEGLIGFLEKVTGQLWEVTIECSNQVISDSPEVNSILNVFKGAKVINIQKKE
ncbi:DNA polymerase III subunit gamma/tau [Wolbachia endosymbiont of Pentidionis agamae]|uniref:DNA polymerase III subunit gamma/tau n=1 Tax=Wolbachia endosymbiont of Pentidionis agamae TaxID=3110435 RepID=UPI002FD43105